MSQIIAIQSFRRGTGKTNIAANLALSLAQSAQRVGLLDADLQAPSLNLLFGLPETDILHTFSHYVQGKCDIQEAVYSLNQRRGIPADGALFLIPNLLPENLREITYLLPVKYSVDLFDQACQTLINTLSLDWLVVDISAGITEETVVTFPSCDWLFVILRPDQQDYPGTSIMVDLAQKLNVPQVELIINQVSPKIDTSQIKQEVQAAFHCPVAAVLPHSQKMMALAGRDLFLVTCPDHAFSVTINNLAQRLVG